MAHKLSGDWRSFTVDSTGQRFNDNSFHLVINEASGTVDPASSTHEGRPVQRGQAVVRDFNRIEILDHRNAFYEGVLVIDLPEFQMLCGRRQLKASRRTGEQADDAGQEKKRDDEGGSAEESKARPGQQEQVIWVATKP